MEKSFTFSYVYKGSKYLIEELTPGLINSYIDETPKNWGTKRKAIYALQVLWEHSKKYMGHNKPLNPTTKEALEVKLPGISKSKNSKYNKRKNGPDEMQKMWLSFQKQSTKHPFQAELIMLMMTAGRHFEEISKIKKLQNIRTPGFTGRKHTVERNRLLSEKTKGRIFSEEHKKKLSESTKKRKSKSKSTKNSN